MDKATKINIYCEDDNAVSVQPDRTKELNSKFSGGQAVMFFRNLLGHFEAGMFY